MKAQNEIDLTISNQTSEGSRLIEQTKPGLVLAAGSAEARRQITWVLFWDKNKHSFY